MKKMFITNNSHDALLVKKFLRDNMSLFNEYIKDGNHLFEVDEIYYDNLIIKQHIYFSQFKHNISYFDLEDNMIPSGYSTIGIFKINDNYQDKINDIIILLKKWFMYYDIRVIPSDIDVASYTFIINNLDESSNKIDIKEFISIMHSLGVELFLNPEMELTKSYTYKKVKQ